ncbi:MAG: hypothetical protein D6734_12410 [Candidatus Schekmanbacteria bacterium]|nr:MAG: hypothetical protein D6734_12410 [Candidatus Schekmanbacteria bacterium]
MTTSEACKNEKIITKEELYELANQAILSAEEFCFSANDRIMNIAGNFRMGNEEAANEEFATVIDDLQMISQLLSDLKIMFDMEEDNFSKAKEIIFNEEQKFLTTVNEILDAQQKEDWILMADLLEFELTAFISSLNNNLKAVKKFI